MKMLPTWWDDIKYFKPSEFDSPDAKGSGGEHMDENFVRDLDMLRSLFGKPLIITSGYRTATHNSKVGGSPKSKHLEGIAADIQVAGEDAHKLLELAFTIGFSGIGTHQKGDWSGRFIHLDNRKQPTIWSY